MTALFLFGTLCHPPLLHAVLGDAAHVTTTSATLPGYAVAMAKDGPFPTIATAPDEHTPGVLVTGLTEADWAQLDYYEAAFDYRPRPVTLSEGQAALAYLPPPGRWTPAGAWSLAAWADHWGALSTFAAEEVMGYFGTRPEAEIAKMFPAIRARAASRLNAADSQHGAGTLKGRIEVIDRTRPYSKFFALDDITLRHERFDGTMTGPLDRAVFVAVDAALVLPYDPIRDRVLLVEQMRMGPLARGDRHCWQLEPIAGRIDGGESPEVAARREAVEEAGLNLGRLHVVSQSYASPGNSSEFCYSYVGIADLPGSVTGTGGLEAEHEDIRTHLMSFDALMSLCDTGQAANAPLVMMAYWLARHRARLRGSS
ncbi:NUDIX domain-containing protein [uncultured Roseobacter sp.]|uniref:NUDIX domain-containing protein n=1 Tax=uncultured Roseobacter sp. TaxID=114847 RepID=UPI00260ADF1B|nr:NUDIX domain-containing protein [uncultured Roseobacter sp.]